MDLLLIEDLAVSYGPIRSVQGIDLVVREGEIVTLIGSNGAGKTSTLNALMGLIPKAGGRVVFDGEEVGKASTETIVRSGMTLTPEGRRVFADMSVDENLTMGAGPRLHRREREGRRERIRGLFPILADRRDQAAGTLSGGEQQQLAIGRSLMSEPRLLMLDEPSLGLAPLVIDTIFDLIVQLREAGTTILLVEQNVDRALAIADRGYVIAAGRIELHGEAVELKSSDAVTAAYFGMEEAR